MRASSSIFLVSSTGFLVGSSTASMRRSTHMGRMTSGYLPRLKRSRRTSSAIPQRKETILLWVAASMRDDSDPLSSCVGQNENFSGLHFQIVGTKPSYRESLAGLGIGHV